MRAFSFLLFSIFSIFLFPSLFFLPKVDLDGNGLINFAEFVMMMRKCKVDTDFDRQIRKAFEV